MLVVLDAIRRSVDDFVVVALSLKLFNTTENRFGFHDHTCFSTERIVIHLPVFVEGVIAQIVNHYFNKTFALGPFENRFVERRYQQFGHDGQNVNTHGQMVYL